MIERVLDEGADFGQNDVGTGTKIVVEHTASQLQELPEPFRIHQALLEPDKQFAESGLLEFGIRASWPINRRILKVFREHASVTDTTDVEGFHRLAHRGDLH